MTHAHRHTHSHIHTYRCVCVFFFFSKISDLYVWIFVCLRVRLDVHLCIYICIYICKCSASIYLRLYSFYNNQKYRSCEAFYRNPPKTNAKSHERSQLLTFRTALAYRISLSFQRSPVAASGPNLGHGRHRVRRGGSHGSPGGGVWRTRSPRGKGAFGFVFM